MRTLLLLLATAAIFVAAICGNSDEQSGSGARIPDDLTVEQVYEQMQLAIDRDNQVLHTRVVIEDVDYVLPPGEEEPNPPPGFDFDKEMERIADQFWIDSEAGVVRVETMIFPSDNPEGEVKVVIVRERTALRDEQGRPTPDPPVCNGTDSALLTRLVKCFDHAEQSTTTVEQGRFKNTDMILLNTVGTYSNDGSTTEFTHDLFVDPETYLPAGLETWTSGRYESTLVRRFDNEFVPLSSLPGDFFEDALVDDPAANLAPTAGEMHVYWIGRLLDPIGELPPITLSRGSIGGNPYQASLDYELDVRGKHVISLQEFTPEAWAEIYNSGVVPTSYGVTMEQLTLPAGRADLYRIPGTYTHYRAHVYFDTTVVMIGDFSEYSPYASREGMVAIIEALRPFDE